MHNGSMQPCCTYHQLKYTSPNRSNKTKTKSHTQSLPFGKWRFRQNRGQETGPKAEKDKTVKQKATRLCRRTRGYIYRKVGSN